MRIWDDILTGTDREIINRAAFARARKLGTSPCLVIVDLQYNYVGDDRPILEQLDRWPAGGGEEAWRVVRKVKRLKEVARRIGIPVIYTRHTLSWREVRDTESLDEVARMISAPVTYASPGSASKEAQETKGVQIVDELAPEPPDIVIDKPYASGLNATPLMSYLIKLKVDTLIVTGCATSGCVRALAVEAAGHLFHVGVVEDCVVDRITLSHKASLLDMWYKFCNVFTMEEAIDYLEHLS